MANGDHTFKHQGQTFDRATIFIAAEAASWSYMAFGKECSFLSRLIKEGFIVQREYAFHPSYWQMIAPVARTGYHTHFHVTGSGRTIYGRPTSITVRK